jgi:hypothetical protein
MERIERIEWPDSPEAIDRLLRELSRELVVREVDNGRMLDAFFSADGWRRLGYATAAQYARERLGTSLSSIKSKRHLARRLSQLRFLAEAVERGELGYEAARLVASVATRETEMLWVARAKGRTVRHLRDELDVAALLARWSKGASAVPRPDFCAACLVGGSEGRSGKGHASAASARQHGAGFPALGGDLLAPSWH